MVYKTKDINDNIIYSDIFQSGNLWIRHKSYEIIEVNNQIYIKPNSEEFSFYNPWEIAVEILKDFLELLQNIYPYYLKFEDKVIKKKQKSNILYDTALKVLKFNKKYGLFGIFYDRVKHFDYINNYKHISAVSNKVQRVILNDDKFRGAFVSLKDPISNELIKNYDNYAKHFFPTIQNNYPNCNIENIYIKNEHKIAKDFDLQFSEMSISRIYPNMLFFINNYSENIESILSNNRMRLILHHLMDTKENILNETYEIPKIGFNTTSMKYQGNEIIWNMKSLIEGISIMYILNINNQLDSQLTICGTKRCRKIFPKTSETHRYCSPKCRKAAQNYRNRNRKKG